ncbi:hypothetical protein G3R49_14110 [Shewanella sp. WXL01]|uniref:Uncharacterized protein n=2 Tax=Shewanellaceae TaxID=267890 RepID=A0A411PN45_9GAMM|nr:DUF6445 family protein [Shewanella sp. WXL01]NKF51696.1 hypothetical protein [Shewanella sp. WXL01]QBF84960.1 hypothetical protein EXU30_17340 [Shewanella maritima]
MLKLIGHSRTPVIIIDDFCHDLSLLQQIAADAPFAPDSHTFYPGLRAPLPKDYSIEVINYLFQMVYDVYRIPHSLRLTPQNLVFSLLTKTADQLAPAQCMPHFDTPSPYYFAILHYLNDSSHGATGFFRHKSTGLERIDQQNMQHYFNQLDKENAQQAQRNDCEPTPAYCTNSNHSFELYDQIEYKQNRIAIYPGNLLHSTLVDPQTDIDANPETGRLTANLFLHFK